MQTVNVAVHAAHMAFERGYPQFEFEETPGGLFWKMLWRQEGGSFKYLLLAFRNNAASVEDIFILESVKPIAIFQATATIQFTVEDDEHIYQFRPGEIRKGFLYTIGRDDYRRKKRKWEQVYIKALQSDLLLTE